VKAIVSKTFFWWKQIIDLVKKFFDSRLERQVKKLFDRISSLSPRRLKRMSSWLIIIFGIGMMWLWNWKLLLATAVGVGFMFLLYLLPSHKWHKYWLRWLKFCHSYSNFLHSNRADFIN
jgi:ABC-type bacteriocin/lantibiotic exporter with double-glycine peptidase domain